MRTNAGVAFGGFVLLHLVVWTALPLIFTHALPLDLVEGVTWGQGWQLGYDQPPFQAWFLGAVDSLSGYQRWAVYLLSQILVGVSFFGVWRLARLIVSPLGALTSVLLLEGVPFFNFSTPNLFPDLIVMPFWALAGWSFYRALRFGRLLDWALLGLCLAGAAYAKYVSALLAAVMVGFMVVEPQARRCWRSPGPYLCAGLCLLLLAPHLWWAYENSFPTVARFQLSAQPSVGALGWITALARFGAGQLAMLLLAGLLTVALGSGRRGEGRIPLANVPASFDRHFVVTLALGPFLLAFVAAALSGLQFRLHWGMAMWCFIGLFAVVFLVPAVEAAGLRRFARGWAGVFLLAALFYGAANTFVSYARQWKALVALGFPSQNSLRRVQEEADFPARELAAAITERWHEKVGDRLAYVVGKKWMIGVISFFSPDHPLGLRIDVGEPQSPWIDTAQLRRQGAIVVFDPSRNQDNAAAMLYERFPMVEWQAPIVLPWHTGAELAPLRIEWGILYPAGWQVPKHSP
jgi:4-amino-4-deoxy-L-arabinose transferase-like glycosyltransferase